jgi:2-aminoadipate transaminase
MEERRTQINFLRGVPADEALQPVAEALADEYARVLTELGGKIIQYKTAGLTDFNGYVPLKQVLAERLGIQGDAQARMICSNGGMETFSLLLKTLPRGSTIVTEAVTYDRVLSDIARHGHRAVGVPLGDDGVDLGALTAALEAEEVAVFYQVAYHQSPSGITVTIENMENASRICAQHRVLHVLDIAYFELRYDGQLNEPIAVDRFPETTCLVGSFTKTLSPGAKCGFGVFPEMLVDRMTPVIANTRLNPNYPTQAAICGLIRSGFYDRHLDYLRRLYGPRMNATNEAIQTFLPELGIPRLRGGFFVSIWLPGIYDTEGFIEALQPKGVLLAPARLFAPGWQERLRKEHDGIYFRLTFPAHSEEQNRRGVELIAETYRELR